ncbi:HvfX family Cu-binding RiPP maturation protein [Thiohalomonas denitrificans]|uniref:HvfX family Cu-binding RiPP maturation protein n=1 Tax=Thiohalomonas denitrificans TaxID=415747 RepID=UPI0026E9CA82|nr:DoxX family protein [Thiohalomonas denitrificans]
MMQPVRKPHQLLDETRRLDFLAPLTLRLYLAPIFWMAGTQKISHMEGTIAWFGNPDWGLGLPFPTVMAWLAALSETGGAIALVLGLAVRWASIPLMVTMAVAALTVHWENSWLAIAESGTEASQRLSGLLDWLAAEHPGRHEFVTELGRPVVLNNGIEFAATYFIMLLTLFFIGGGRYLSIDYWLHRRYMTRGNHYAD